MTPTTNILVRLDDVSSIMNTYSGHTHIGMAMGMIAELPTYPEPIKGSNHELLQRNIDDLKKAMEMKLTSDEVLQLLIDIQEKLIEPMEYEIGKEVEYEDGKGNWQRGTYHGYIIEKINGNVTCVQNIRPIQQSTEVTSAIALLEANGEYVITKK